MATTSGLVLDFRKVHLIIGAGFRVDAYADAGLTGAWQGDQNIVVPGADNINVIVTTGNNYAIITTSLMSSSLFINYVSGWLSAGGFRPLSLEDANGTTFLSDPRAIPRQNPDMVFAAAENPRVIDIHCPNLNGVVGAIISTA